MDSLFSTGSIAVIEMYDMPGSPAYSFADTVPRSVHGSGAYRETAVFTPGAMNFQFMPAFENPVFDIKGQAQFAGTNYWKPLSQVGQIMSFRTQTNAGLGGLQAGAFALTPLTIPDSDSL